MSFISEVESGIKSLFTATGNGFQMDPSAGYGHIDNWIQHLRNIDQPVLRPIVAELETLRRVSVLAWHRGFALPQSQINAFHAAGYSEEQLEMLLASVGAGRLANKRKAFS